MKSLVSPTETMLLPLTPEHSGTDNCDTTANKFMHELVPNVSESHITILPTESSRREGQITHRFEPLTARINVTRNFSYQRTDGLVGYDDRFTRDRSRVQLPVGVHHFVCQPSVHSCCSDRKRELLFAIHL